MAFYTNVIVLYIIGKLQSPSLKWDSYHSSIPTHTKAISSLVKLTFIQISWPFSIRLSLFKVWIPLLTDGMVKQTFASFSV